ncbi:hypothetical protein CHS0354_024168 [Potamilus streckersoni]|uniref:Uncharacterized protein n=1 Tax=Potamilus streckersoni TaxID=2493646 RepID=A0AAE0VLS8_9BIVA|nr:hypothetical protein CHS0354_024168 [Potamilus streckersoni]
MLSVVPAVIGLTIWVGRKVRSHTKDAQSQLSRSTVLAEESFQGIQTVKAYSSEIFEKNRYNSSLISFLRIFIKRAQVRALLVSAIMAGLFSAIVVVLWYGMTLVQTGSLTLGELTAFVIYTVFAGGAANVVSDVYSQFQKAAGIGERITEMLQKEKEHLGDTTSWGGLKINGEVEFENVSFNYPTRHNIIVLNNISFKVRKGERVALVGPSGSGKTTITALLFRFFDTTKGRILIDGKNINSYPLAMFRKECAIVQQDVYLFGRTIYENIVYGKPNATREDVIAAAKQANAHEFVSRIPEQYDALVGERGIQLSGGQKQRIAIARAILRNPKILILDEATSALDSESEKQVQTALELLMENRTSIIISHRLSTIRTADNILVLDHGNMIEQGTHDELNKKQDGVYKNLSYLQTTSAT